MTSRRSLSIDNHNTTSPSSASSSTSASSSSRPSFRSPLAWPAPFYSALLSPSAAASGGPLSPSQLAVSHHHPAMRGQPIHVERSLTKVEPVRLAQPSLASSPVRTRSPTPISSARDQSPIEEDEQEEEEEVIDHEQLYIESQRESAARSVKIESLTALLDSSNSKVDLLDAMLEAEMTKGREKSKQIESDIESHDLVVAELSSRHAHSLSLVIAEHSDALGLLNSQASDMRLSHSLALRALTASNRELFVANGELTARNVELTATNNELKEQNRQLALDASEAGELMDSVNSSLDRQRRELATPSPAPSPTHSAPSTPAGGAYRTSSFSSPTGCAPSLCRTMSLPYPTTAKRTSPKAALSISISYASPSRFASASASPASLSPNPSSPLTSLSPSLSPPTTARASYAHDLMRTSFERLQSGSKAALTNGFAINSSATPAHSPSHSPSHSSSALSSAYDERARDLAAARDAHARDHAAGRDLAAATREAQHAHSLAARDASSYVLAKELAAVRDANHVLLRRATAVKGEHEAELRAAVDAADGRHQASIDEAKMIFSTFYDQSERWKTERAQNALLQAKLERYESLYRTQYESKVETVVAPVQHRGNSQNHGQQPQQQQHNSQKDRPEIEEEKKGVYVYMPSNSRVRAMIESIGHRRSSSDMSL